MTETAKYPYVTHLDARFAPLSVVDVPALVARCKDRWYNQTLCRVNDSVVRLGVLQGEYHWHKHDRDDEFFFVLEGASSSTSRTARSSSARRRGSWFRAAFATARARRSASSC